MHQKQGFLWSRMSNMSTPPAADQAAQCESSWTVVGKRFSYLQFRRFVVKLVCHASIWSVVCMNPDFVFCFSSFHDSMCGGQPHRNLRNPRTQTASTWSCWSTAAGLDHEVERVGTSCQNFLKVTFLRFWSEAGLTADCPSVCRSLGVTTVNPTNVISPPHNNNNINRPGSGWKREVLTHRLQLLLRRTRRGGEPERRTEEDRSCDCC